MSLSNMDVDSSCVSPQETTTGVFEYSHMVVPASMRSHYWQYFGFPCDKYNNIVTKKKIICTLCNTVISYNKNTSNLRTHLVAKHPSTLYQLNKNKRLKTDDKCPDSSDDSKLKTATIKTYCKKEFDDLNPEDEQRKINEQTAIIEALVENEIIVNETDKICDRNNYQEYGSLLCPQTYHVEEIDEASPPSQEVVNESVMDMLVKDMLPSSIIEGVGFTNFVFTISPDILLPTKDQVEKSLKSTYDTSYNSQLELVKSHTNKHPFSLGIEMWNNVEHTKFINIYVNFIPEKKDILKSVLLKTVKVEETNNNGIFDGIELSNCTAAIVNSNDNIFNELFDANGIPIVICFWTIIQNCFREAFKVAEVETLLKEVQKYLHKNDSMCQDESIPPRLHESFPMTKFNFLSYFYDNFSTIYYSSWTQEDNDLLDKTKEIIDCLTPLKVTLETLSDEPVCLYSLLKPLTTKLLNEYFRMLKDDSQMIFSIKEVVANVLSECALNKTFPDLATFFDPRFLKHIDTDSFEIVKTVVIAKLNVTEVPITLKKTNDDSLTKRKSSLKMFFENDDVMRNPKVVKTKSELEIQKYANELCDMDQCPLAWWNENGFVYRQLKTIAHQYMCVPATLNNLFKKSINEQIDFYHKQKMLKSEVERHLLFLHLNK